MIMSTINLWVGWGNGGESKDKTDVYTCNISGKSWNVRKGTYCVVNMVQEYYKHILYVTCNL